MSWSPVPAPPAPFVLTDGDKQRIYERHVRNTKQAISVVEDVAAQLAEHAQ